MAAETENVAATLLTAETVPGYLVGRGVFGPAAASVTARAIVGGNINYAFQGSVSLQA